ncbi:hypothetical protein BV898_05533 [Hypsibius exemplaris]|uniref:Uncharacterized protein n=1 Tax=Hypsibius exemplaris TaxID=2072580 RepID=A0A1W0WZ61_HYPEX|nr:hypothetical protein BV898_05533 [Hypsibius exemplaris]
MNNFNARYVHFNGQRFPAGTNINSGNPSDSLSMSSMTAAGTSMAASASGNGNDNNASNSITAQSRPLEPKYRRLSDLERNVDRSQAESLKMMRLGHREGHRLLIAPRDFFYRNLLIPVAARAFLLQLWTSYFLIIWWTGLAGILDVIFAHCFIRTEMSFLQDLCFHLSLPTIFRLWTILGAVLLSAASVWNYLQLVRIPPPLFANRMAKLVEFLKTLAFNGPCALVCAAVVCLRPEYQVQHEISRIIPVPDATANSGAISTNTDDATSLSDVFLWEIVLKTVFPALYLMATFVAGNFVHFWLGDFFIGVVKVSPHGPSLLSVQNPFVFLKQLSITICSAVIDAVQPVLLLPGRNFWKYHFLAFAILHAWKLNLLQMRSSLAQLHRFGHLELVDWIALPPVLANLRKPIGWWWCDYLEIQLRAVFLEQLKNQPNFLSGFLSMRIPTRDLNQLDGFVRFWLQPIQDFSRHMHVVQFLVEADQEPRSRRLDFLHWATGQLQHLHDHYAHKSLRTLLEQDFAAYQFACLAKPSVKVIEHVRCVALFAVRAKAVDARNVLGANYGKILEQVAALSVILEKAGERFEDLTDGRLFQQYPNMEPCIRFYIKSYRQLEHLTRLNLSELITILAKDMSELRFKEFPELMPYVDSLFQQTKSR